MRLLYRNDTSKPLLFLMVDAVDHLTGKTGLTPTVTISKNGSSFAAPAGTVSEVGYGWYKLTPASNDVDTLGPLILHAEATGADPADVEYRVVAYNPDDASNLGLSFLNTKIGSLSGAVVSDTSNSAVSFKTNLTGSSAKFVGMFLRFRETAAAANEMREIIGFNETTQFVTVNRAFSAVPANADVFDLFGYSGR